jgi:hypothetical protein
MMHLKQPLLFMALALPSLFRSRNVSYDYDHGLADKLYVEGHNYRENEILASPTQKPLRTLIGTENRHDRTAWVTADEEQLTVVPVR